jgi:hypothetical protein
VIAGVFDSQGNIAISGDNLPIKAGTAARMAGRPVASDAHFQPERILIAIRAQLDHALQIARRLAFLPERRPRADQ